MADIDEKYAENVPGPYYVAKVCIGCNLCSEIAPENFCENIDMELYSGNCYVCKQPAGETEQSLCMEAMDACPADAIRDDGLL